MTHGDATRRYWIEELEQQAERIAKFYKPDELGCNTTEVVKASDYDALAKQVDGLEQQLKKDACTGFVQKAQAALHAGKVDAPG